MIYVVGLGPGDPGLVSRRGWDLLTKSGIEVILRTEKHPVAAALAAAGVGYATCDHYYETSSDFSHVYARIVSDILTRAHDVVYAVPGNPFVAEATVMLLTQEATREGVPIEVVPSMSSIEAVYGELGIDPSKGLALLDALDPEMVINPRLGLLIAQVYSRLVAGDLKLRLLEIYPPEHAITVVRGAGTSESVRRDCLLSELDYEDFTYADTVYVPPCDRSRHVGVAIEELQKIMASLRSENGCPWDREQTHASLRPYLIEETYEVIEALDAQDHDKLADELGDLLLQIVFHAQIASENHNFDLVDAIQNINRKLVRRHPHVFADVQVSSAADVMVNWQRIKKGEQRSNQGVLDNVPLGLPALQQAYKLQNKAKQVGFDWPTIDGAWQKLQEELAELREAVKAADASQTAKELGDLLFSVVNVSRFLGIDPETALRDASGKFKKRFAVVEELARKYGLSMEECSLEELDKLWDEAKARGL